MVFMKSPAEGGKSRTEDTPGDAPELINIKYFYSQLLIMKTDFKAVRRQGPQAMRLTQYSGYGLRALMYVGLKGEELSTIAEIAEAHGISRNHLMKVVQQMAAEGFVYSRRGKNGGIRLASSPDQLTVGEVVRKLEPNFGVADCMRADRKCVLVGVCRLRAKLREASEAFLRVLDDVSLADLLDGPAHQLVMRELLGQELMPGSAAASQGTGRQACFAGSTP
jgi:Rrf2 family nitric oxide-sensitive transcriptional repressor